MEEPGVQGDDLVRALDGFEGLLVRGATKVTGDVLRAPTTLRVVARAGTGLDNVDAAAARQKGIAVRNKRAGDDAATMMIEALAKL